MMYCTIWKILLSLLTVNQICSASLSAEKYCLCLEFDRESCFCGPQEVGNGAVIYCNGRNSSTSFPAIENLKSCRLIECTITIVFEYYRAKRIQNDLFANIVKSDGCVIGFVHRYNPDLREIGPRAFTTDASTIRDMRIEHTGLNSTTSIEAALKTTKFECGGNTVVSFSHNRLNDWLNPQLTSSLKCVDSFSLSNNPHIHFWMMALHGLNLSRLSLSKISADQISEFTLSGSKITYMDMSNNDNLIVKSAASDGSSENGASNVVIENLKLSTSAAITYSLAISNDPISPKRHLVCSKQASQCGCINLSSGSDQLSLREALKACDLASNVCSKDCNDSMFSIPDDAKVPSQYKEYLMRGVAFNCVGRLTDTLTWYQITNYGSIVPMKLEIQQYRITMPDNGTMLSSKLLIMDFAKPLTALCLRSPREKSNEFLALDLIDYPGDGKILEPRYYKFTGRTQPEFQFNRSRSSIFNCEQVEKSSTNIELKTELHAAGVFLSEGFNGSFCCYAINERRQRSADCARMRVNSEPQDHLPWVTIAVGAVAATIVLASIAFAISYYQYHKRKKLAAQLRMQYQQIEEERQGLLEENEKLRSRFADIYNRHVQLISRTSETQKSDTNHFINEIVDELIFDRNSRIITIFPSNNSPFGA